MNEYQVTYNQLIGKLKSTRNKETLHLALTGIFKTLTSSIAVLIIITVIEFIANGDIPFRMVLFGSFVASVCAFFAIFLLPVLARATGIKNRPDIEQIALRIGYVYPDIKDRLCNSLQLIDNINKPNGTSTTLAIAAFQNVYSISKDKDFDAIINKKSLKKVALLFFIAFIFSATILGIFSSSLGYSLYRIIHWNESFLPPAPFSLTIEPLNTNILRGEKAIITIKAQGQPPDIIELHIKETQQEEFDKYILRLDSGNVYRYEIFSIKNSVEYFARANWLNYFIDTEKGKINVIDKPLISVFSGRIIFPTYTKLSSREFDEKSADISALKGSLVELSIISNKDLEFAEIVFESAPELNSFVDSSKNKPDTIHYNMSINGRKANGSFRINKSGFYYINLRDLNGQQNENPIRYSIIAQNDDYPSIALIEPTSDIRLSESAQLPMKIAITDDYGFSALKLYYRLIESKFTEPEDKFSSINIPLLNNENSVEVPYLWNLNSIDISPNDKYEFYIEVYDNDIVNGPKSARTRSLTARLPSLEEVLKDADKEQKKIEKELENTMNKIDEVKKDIEDLNKELMKANNKKELDWKQIKKTEDILKKQEEINKKIQDIQEKLDDVTQQLDENKVLSPETLEKYLELQKLLREIDSPELRQLQKRLEEAMKQISPEELQKAMREFKFNEEEFRKNIERTMKILKRLQAEQKVDALTKRAEELLKKQEEIQKQLENSNPSDEAKRNEIADKQKANQDELNSIQKELNELEKLMKEIGDQMPMKELDKAKDALNPNDTKQQMQNTQNSAKSGDFNDAKGSCNNASKNLKNFAAQMQNLKKEMNNKVTQEAMRKLKKAIDDMLKLSKEQESIKEQTQKCDYSSTQIPELANKQAQLSEAVSNVAGALMELSQKSFAVTPQMAALMGEALKQMQQTLQSMANMNTNQATKSQSSAMSAMNQAIMKMQNMLSNLQSRQSQGSCPNPGGQGQGQGQGGQGNMGFMDRLQSIANQQQAINKAMQEMSSNEGRLSLEQRAQLGRIAGEQGRAQKSLEELANEQKQFSDNERKALGNLEKIVEEMKEVISDLKSGNITPETLKRQERILSRLLDATRSINDRDYERKRESRPGVDVIKKSPGAIDLSTQEGKSKAFQEFLKSIQQGYNKDFEELIRQYFESLQKVDN